jgi:sugar phosphate isomerase/epimerase
MAVTDRRTFLAAGVAAGTVQPASAEPVPPRKFGLGLVTYNLAARWDLATLLTVCRDTGIAAVEFRTTHAHGVEPTLSKDARRDVRQRCTDAGVVIWGSGTTCEFHSPDAATVTRHVEECKRFVDLVRDLGGRGVKVRPNALPKDVPPEKTLEQIGRALRECGRAAADAGVEIWVEVHGPGTQLPQNMRTVMEQCGHPSVGVTWNSNPTDVQKGSVAGTFGALEKWIKSCHINELYKDADGRYPYRELFRLLRGKNFDRYTLIEVARTPPDVASGTELLRYYRALWLAQTIDGPA